MLSKIDKSQALFIVAAVVFFWIGGLFTTLAPPLLDESWARPTEGLKDYATLAAEGDEEAALIVRGREIYVSEGCWYCHTQQVRSLLYETQRYGMAEEETYKRYGIRARIQAPPSQPGEYVFDTPHLLGTRRTGPDLGRVGGKYDNSWHINHLRDPRSTSPGSIMPAYSWVFTNEGQPTEDAIALTAYLQKLGTNLDWRAQGVEVARRLAGEEPGGGGEEATGLLLAHPWPSLFLHSPADVFHHILDEAGDDLAAPGLNTLAVLIHPKGLIVHKAFFNDFVFFRQKRVHLSLSLSLQAPLSSQLAFPQESG